MTSSTIDFRHPFASSSSYSERRGRIGFAVREDFRPLYPASAKTPTCCPSDDNRTKVTNSVTLARSLWWHVGPYFWPADLTRTANPNATVVWTIRDNIFVKTTACAVYSSVCRCCWCYCCCCCRSCSCLVSLSLMLLLCRGLALRLGLGLGDSRTAIVPSQCPGFFQGRPSNIDRGQLLLLDLAGDGAYRSRSTTNITSKCCWRRCWWCCGCSCPISPTVANRASWHVCWPINLAGPLNMVVHTCSGRPGGNCIQYSCLTNGPTFFCQAVCRQVMSSTSLRWLKDSRQAGCPSLPC